MLRFHHVDVEALAPWIDRLDPVEVDLCGLLQSMNSDNPKVKEWMHWGFFGLTNAYIRDAMPWIRFERNALSRRVAHLIAIGLWSRSKRKWLKYHPRLGAVQIRLVRFSPRYWKYVADLNEQADAARTRIVHLYRDTPPLSRGAQSLKSDLRGGASFEASALLQGTIFEGVAGGVLDAPAPPEQPQRRSGEKKVPICPHCGSDASNDYNYDYIDCHGCRKHWPGEVKARAYFDALAGGKS